MKSARGLLLLPLLALALPGAEGVPASPFLPGVGAAPGAVTENAPLELRGIVGTGANRLFNIYDPSSKLSRWVALNEPGLPFTVKLHDEATDTVTLDYAGRPLSLRLTEAKIMPLAPGAAPVPVPAIANARPRPENANSAPGTPEFTAEQAKRLENVAAEVARRRALRAAGQQGQAPAQQPPSQPPAGR